MHVGGGGVSEHSQALKVNTSFISSRILSSIIKAVSKTICIILSVGAGLAPAVQSMQNEWHWGHFWRWHSDIQSATQRKASNTGELQHTAVCYYCLYDILICCFMMNYLMFSVQNVKLKMHNLASSNCLLYPNERTNPKYDIFWLCLHWLKTEESVSCGSF